MTMREQNLAELFREFSVSEEVCDDVRTLFEELVVGRTESLRSVLAEMVDEGLTISESISLWSIPEPPTEEPVPPLADFVEPTVASGPLARYEDLGLIGMGGMGEVRRVRDRDLNRTLAMKIIHARGLARPFAVARFLEEAQVTAQLQHPGILPVHEVGRLQDGRLYYTMKEVRGRPFSEIIAEVHAASIADCWEASPSGWTFRRLIETFQRVCEAMAYAHACGVIHRDLKPANVMVGAHGEVLVVDWGLAKVLARPSPASEATAIDEVVTERSGSDGHATRQGAVVGTPAYMPPEQARGDIERLNGHSDVYSLGAILYEVLSGRPPFDGPTPLAVLMQVLSGELMPPGRVVESVGASFTLDFDEQPPEPEASGPPLPHDLVHACLKALSRDPTDRFGDAGTLATEISAWLQHARHRERGLALVAAAAPREPQADALRAQAAVLRAEATALLAETKPWEPAANKAPGWAKQDQAADLERQAERKRLEGTRRLHGALTHAPDLPEAHAVLAAIYQWEHARAEGAGETEGMDRAEALLWAHAGALPAAHPSRTAAFAYLKGVGAVTLLTNPPGAEAVLYRYQRRNRRLVPVFDRVLGKTPLCAEPVQMGSWLLELSKSGYAKVRYPVFIGRGEHWDGVPPNEIEPHVVPLPAAKNLGPHEIYVPPGWFWCGGDAEAPGSLPRQRVWVDGFAIQPFSVTNGEYVAFLNDLVAQGREDETLRYTPRERPGTVGELGRLVYRRDASGCFTLPAGDDDQQLPNMQPVVWIDWHSATAYAAWLGEKTNLPCRLPWELEWEKAARGVDGRFFPWGGFIDPSWCCFRDSDTKRAEPASVDSYPVDESPWGVRGMAGNISDWCADIYRMDGPAVVAGRWSVVEASSGAGSSRVIRGGHWGNAPRDCRSAMRAYDARAARTWNIGVRPARSIP